MTIEALAERTDENLKCCLYCRFNDVVFLSILDHQILLKKLERYGVRGICYPWFKSNMTDRYQCVKVNSGTSDWLNVSTGVPQGSVLGPLLLLKYINELDQAVLKSCVFVFADDRNTSCESANFNEYQLALTNISYWLGSVKKTLIQIKLRY